MNRPQEQGVVNKDQDDVCMDNIDQSISRRRLLKLLTTASGTVAATALLPGKWRTPTLKVGVLPPHAQVSQPLQTVNLVIASAIGDPVSLNESGPFNLTATAHYGTPANYNPPDPCGWSLIPNAQFIWYNNELVLYFEKRLAIPAVATQITGHIQITADNYFNIWVNGMNYGGMGAPWDACSHQGVIHSYDIANLVPGDNQLLIRAEEIHPGTPSMLIYKMTGTYQVPGS